MQNRAKIPLAIVSPGLLQSLLDVFIALIEAIPSFATALSSN